MGWRDFSGEFQPIHSIVLDMGKILPVLLVLLFLSRISWSQDGVRQFTNKNGQQIKAALLDVSSDKKNMKIRREDGAEFETEIVALSLDDQQYIKDWLKNRPSKSDFRLDVAISKKVIESETRPYRSNVYKLHQDQLGYEVTVRNLSRESIPNPVISYQIIRLEGASVYPDSDGDWTFTGTDSDENKDEYVLGGTEESTDPLAFNREWVVTTTPMVVERVMNDTAVYFEDELLGVIVQVKTEKGDLIGEFRSNGKEIQDLKWEEVADFKPDQNNGLRRPRVRPDRDMEDGPASYSMQKGDQIDGPVSVDRMSISITADVAPASNGDGVIVSVGGDRKGLAIFLKEKRVVAVQNIDGNHREVEVRQPLGNFKVGVNLTEKELQLLIDGEVVARRDSGGLFEGAVQNGIEVGQDSDRPVGDYDAPFPFPGGISNVTVQIGL